MSVDTAPPRAPRTRRSVKDRLHAALADLHSHQGQIVSHRETPWASITFAGTRHAIALVFLGDEAVTAGEDFVAALPDHEFALPGQLVADAAVTTLEHRLLPTPRMVVECELLLLEDA